jgi:hypothetical protein
MNMNKKLLLLGFLLSIAFSANAQLDMKRNFRQAFESGTRSMDGKPGEAYWQNRSDYQIEANIDPATRTLTGSETITYTNNSPDSLSRLTIRLYQDIMKKGNARDSRIPEDDLTDGVTLSRVAINDKVIDVSKPSSVPSRYSRGPAPRVRRSGTNLFLRLDDKLAPGRQVKVDIDWSFIIPNFNRLRMGTYGPATFFVAYWYPQIAVYDDIDGWDTNNYMGTVEMYNDFGSFEVAFTMPDSVMVWGTGVLQNADEVLAPTQLDRYNKAWKSDDVVRIVTKEDQEKGDFLQKGENGMLTWRYKAEYVPDFAFGVSESYLWDGCSIEVEPGRRVFTDAAYRPEGQLYDQAAAIARVVVEDLSTGIPAVPYPYPSVTVFNGSGGMEFPMIVNDGPVRSEFGLLTLTHHEIAHTYFPFYMGINERKYAWMDEGWAQFLPNDLARKRHEESPNPLRWVALSVSATSGRDTELPLMTPSYATTNAGYGNHAYSKPAMAYNFLRDMLGHDVFIQSMQQYIDDWNGKHPIPYDFFNSFNASTGKNLDWYWEPWFFQTIEPDLALTDVKVKGGKMSAVVRNVGGLPVPAHITVTFDDSSSEEIHHTAMVWENSDELTIKKKFDKNIKMIAVGGQTIPETNRKDNKWTR